MQSSSGPLKKQPAARFHTSCVGPLKLAAMGIPAPGASTGSEGAGDGGDAIHKFGAEEHIGVVEHALLEGHHNELGVGEVAFDHGPNVLRVAQVQCGIHLQPKARLCCRADPMQGRAAMPSSFQPWSAAALMMSQVFNLGSVYTVASCPVHGERFYCIASLTPEAPVRPLPVQSWAGKSDDQDEQTEYETACFH